MQYLIDNNITDKGEFQLTDALENMKKKGTKFAPGEVKEWLDCGNYKATVYTNQRVLEHIKNENIVDSSLKNEGSKIITKSAIFYFDDYFSIFIINNF